MRTMRRTQRLAGIGRRTRAAIVATAAVAVMTISTTGWAQVASPDVTTDFAFRDLDGFSLGTSPESVTFSAAGDSKTVGIPPLYRSGFRSYMVPNQTTAQIDFETPAAAVAFHTRQQTQNVAGVIDVFGEAGTQLDSIAVSATTTDPFQLVSLDAATLDEGIDRIELTNNSPSPDSDYLVIDDFSARAVPEPSSGALIGIGVVSLLCRRRRVL